MKKYNPFHLVDLSPWPIITSLVSIRFGLGVIIIVRIFYCTPFILSILLLLFSSFLWGRDINRESCYNGLHNNEVITGFKIGIILFIFSEIFFFLGIFWAYLHLAQSPAVELGSNWPPFGINVFDPKGIPFLNTILLVSSGISVTWTHHAIEIGEFKERLLSLLITIFLGVIFTCLQLIEYYLAGFTFSCSCYSSVYFIGTGFHGFHVLIGTLLLTICLFRFSRFFISPIISTGFECSVWYWHFVDVVWFCLYLVFYWWGV